MRDTTGLGRDPGNRGTAPGASSTTAGTYPGEYGLEGHHFRHGESMAPLSTVPGTSLPATASGGDVRRHEGPISRHEERTEARREGELGTGGYDEGPHVRREEHKGHHHREGPFERHEERKEHRTEEELGTGGMSRREARRLSTDEPSMTNVPGTKYGGFEETRGGGSPKQQSYTTASHPGAGVTGGTAYTETGAQSGRGIHAQQYERHPEHHLGERERQHLTTEERLAAERRAEGGHTGRERQNLEAQQGAGGVGVGYGDTQRTGAGYGDTQHAGAGYGDTQRADVGYGDTQRAGNTGYGDTQRAGAGYGDTQRADVGYGDTQRAGDTGHGVKPTGTGAYHGGTGTAPGKVSLTDKVIGMSLSFPFRCSSYLIPSFFASAGGEKLAGKVTSNAELYEQGTQRQVSSLLNCFEIRLLKGNCSAVCMSHSLSSKRVVNIRRNSTFFCIVFL